MKTKVFSPSSARSRWFHLSVPALALLLASTARGALQDIDLNCDPAPGAYTFDATVGTAFNATIQASGNASNADLYWSFNPPPTGCAGASPTITCNGVSISLPSPPPSAPGSAVTLGGTPAAAGSFTYTVRVETADGSLGCNREYTLDIRADGGGEGEPHLTTVDGVHYDFQSAGEFVLLRGHEFEIQVRQTPLATDSPAGYSNPYTGLATCVSFNTAVAARLGSHRVSFQPSLSGVPDPSGMQLRIDGALTDLKAGEAIYLCEDGTNRCSGAYCTGGRISKTADGGGIEIDFPNRSKLIVTTGSGYLNVNVYDTTANEGLIGKRASGSWLPALPDGSSLGPLPASLHDRYVSLNETFADAWRVTDPGSLFDYAPGTSTATFTLDDWPKENPSSCAVAGQAAGQVIDIETAEEICDALIDPNRKANCVFDVSLTGDTGFAETYLRTERLEPGRTKTTVKDDKDPSRSGESVTFTATVAPEVFRIGVGNPSGAVRFMLDGSELGKPVALDADGQAAFTTAILEAGRHQFQAQYLPAEGSPFLESSSRKEGHRVVAVPGWYWLISLLIGIVLLLLGRRYRMW